MGKVAVGCWGSVRFDLLRSAMCRRDVEAVRIFLHDWLYLDARPGQCAYKYVPGEHFYALNTKFNTLNEAISHLTARGYRYAGLHEERVQRLGD